MHAYSDLHRMRCVAVAVSETPPPPRNGLPETVAAWAAVAAVACVPFALGGGPGWGWGTAAGVLGGALVAEGAVALLAPRPSAGRVTSVQVACAVALAVVVLTLLQAVPGLPGAHPVWTDLGDALGRTPPGTWSMTPGAALSNAVLVAAAAASLWLGSRARGTVREQGPVLIAAAAALAALYGLLVLRAGSEQVLWLAKPAYRDVATGPFISRNAFAAFLGVGLMALAAAVWPACRRGGAPGWWAAAIGLTILAGLGASASRGGIAATVLALTVVAAHWAWHDGRPRVRLATGASLLGLVLAGAAVLAPRLAAVPEALERRAAIHRMALEAVGQRPWLGHGAGASEAVFRQLRPDDLAFVVTRAHSVCLDAALAWGVPAAVALLVAGAALAVTCARAGRGGDPAGVAGLGCCVLLGAHGLIDSAPLVPGVALPALWLIGAGAAPQPPR